MGIWRIAEWSREKGRGAIVSSQFAAPLPFDAAVALVDDFQIGESVEITLTKVDHVSKVSKIWPVSARANPAVATESRMSPKVSSVVKSINKILATVNGYIEVCGCQEDELSLRIRDQDFRTISIFRFHNPSYLQIQWSLECDDLRLVAYSWPNWLRQNQGVAASWSADEGDIDDNMLVFAFESTWFGQRTQYVVARGLSV